jgi:Rieske Fe-S protein
MTTDDRDRAREPVDPRVDTPGREGLTGTAPQDAYAPAADREQISEPPDGRPWDEQPAWRRDFPIDSALDQYTARREFMKFMVLISFSFTVGQFWIGVQNWLRRRRRQPEIRRIASLADVPVGGVLGFNYPDDHEPCILMRPSEDVVVAWGQKCTHLSCAVIPRPAAGVIDCPCHQGVFDALTGRPLAGPPRRPLGRVLLEIRGDDIYATGVELRTV